MPFVERNADHIDAEPGQPVQRALIGVLLDNHGVATRQQRPLTRSSACSEPETIRMSSATQLIPGVALEFLVVEIRASDGNLRAAGEAVGGEASLPSRLRTASTASISPSIGTWSDRYCLR